MTLSTNDDAGLRSTGPRFDTAPQPAEQESLRHLAETLPQLVWIADAHGHHRYFNQQWLQYTGLTLEEALTVGWGLTLHPEDYPRTMERWGNSNRTGLPFEMEYRYRRAIDGEYRWFLGRALPRRDDDGRIIEWVGTCTDIHDQKQAEEVLRQAKDEIERANNAKDQFLATISHELRTPLNAILGWTQMIQLGLMTATETSEAINSIERNAKVQAQLIEDILDVSRIINHKLRIELQPIVASDILRLAISAIHPQAAEKGIQIDSRIDDDLIAMADPSRLQQIVWNLLTNSCKFTPRDGHIEIVMDRADHWLRIQVHDSGIGICPKFLPHVFERFRQADGSSTRHHGGLGLGLAIVKHLVDLHGGHVSADSPGSGEGATFTVLLPMAAVRPFDVRHPPRQVARRKVPENALLNVDCLVVEDDVSAREVVSTLLRKHGAVVRAASAVDEAWQQFQARTPDIVLSDIAMPDHDGYDLIRRIREKSPAEGGQVPSIALTAYASVQDRTRALEQGFDRHLSKPVEPEELVLAVIDLRASRLLH